MTNERYNPLNSFEGSELTESEIFEGWHFCSEFDGLCRNSNDESFKCGCNEYQNLQLDAHCVDYYFQTEVFI